MNGPEFARRFVEAMDGRLGERLRAAVLFGSWARGEAGPRSDIDLLVILRDAPPLLDRCFLAAEVARAVHAGLAAVLSPVLLDEREAQATRPLYLDAVVDGVVLLDRDRTWASIRERLLLRMRELGSKRLVDDQGNRYWLLAPAVPPGTPIEL